MVWGRWLALFTVVTAFFAVVPELPELRVAHGVLVYLLLIVGASREADWRLSICMVAASYFAVDWFFVPPRRAMGMPSRMDVIILLGFLVTAAVISRLVYRLQNTATVATARAEEIERLSAEQVRLEKEAARADVLREAERLKNALIASLTHDLRSPLSTLSMLADRASGIPASTALARISAETKRLTEFVVSMRRYAFTEEQSVSPILVESHVVDDLVGTALRSREDILQGRAVSLHLPSDPPLILVRCDFTLSLQIMANLLENAARYAPPSTPIDVIVTTRQGEVDIAVADRGPGLSPADAMHVFEPTRRGSAALGVHGMVDGQGMGLAIARTFAQAQRGDVRYRPRDGGGAEFSLVLPAAAISAA